VSQVFYAVCRCGRVCARYELRFLGETVLKEVLLFYSLVVESLTESVLERVKKIDKKLDELKTFLEDVFLTPEESVLLKDVDRLVKGKKFGQLTALDDV